MRRDGRWRKSGRQLAGRLGLCLPLALSPVAAAAQGPGSAGAQTLTLTAGARAAALGGAYTAMTGDPDGVFYNPAAVARVDGGVALGYEEYVEEITLGSFSGGLDVGRLRVGAGLVYLSAGEVQEVVPDPLYGGERGRPTGATVGATEAAARLAAALPFLEDRASAGIAVGVVTSQLAGTERAVLFLDLGAQYHWHALSVGGALRNLDSGMRSRASGAMPLPLEARLGAAYRRELTAGFGALLTTDLVLALEEETAGVAVGVEAGLLPGRGAVTAVLRAGTIAGSGHHLGRVRIGGGVGIGALSLDYTVQSFEYFGAIHRFGIRWSP